MNSYKKSITVIAALVAVFSMCFFVVNRELTRAPYVSLVTQSGDYQIEVVRASWLLSASGMVYLRFVEIKNSSHVYRTPLTSETSLDMQSFEDEDTVGVTWIDLSKSQGVFTLSVPNWREHWANFVISNTPYKVLDN
ncbi:hypothetical protein [Pseudomonas sp. GM79]|uniref:hypothetical protein n=1 Tax=Pseudomonas sp. GM79 TaxID=1144338 RepID=UPI0006AD06B7|nr:hypothetical protein [Pseudomonas sp. GM79]